MIGRAKRLAAMALCATMVGTGATAQPAEIRIAGATWFVNESEGQCTLHSPIIGGNTVNRVEIITGMYGANIRGLSLAVTPALTKLPMVIGIKFGDRPVERRTAVSGGSENGKARIFVDFDDDKATSAVDLATPVNILIGIEGETIGVTTRNLAPKLVELKACKKKSLVARGVDITALDKIVTPPVRTTPIAHMFHSDDYPIEALKRDMSARLNLLLAIDERGKVTNCSPLSESSYRPFVQRSCAGFRRSRYEPARDKDGKAVPSFDFQVVRWVP